MKPLAILKSAHKLLIPPQDSFSWEVLRHNLQKNAFREPLAPTKEPACGWVDPDDILSTSFEGSDWILHNYAILTFREDRRVLQKPLVNAKLRAATSAWCREHSRDRCPATVKEEIREAVEMDLLKHVLPTIHTWSAIWNVQEGWMAVQNCPTAVLETFRKAFHSTTELLPSVESFGDDLEDPITPFRAWLLRRSDEEAGMIPLGEGAKLEWWVDGSLSLTSEAGKVSAPFDGLAASAALAGGSDVSSLPIVLKHDDREYRFTIGKNGRRTGLKLPALIKGGDPLEAFSEAVFLYEEAEQLFSVLLRRFLERWKIEGPQGAAADARWRKQRMQDGWEDLMRRLEKA